MSDKPDVQHLNAVHDMRSACRHLVYEMGDVARAFEVTGNAHMSDTIFDWMKRLDLMTEPVVHTHSAELAARVTDRERFAGETVVAIVDECVTGGPLTREDGT